LALFSHTKKHTRDDDEQTATTMTTNQNERQAHSHTKNAINPSLKSATNSTKLFSFHFFSQKLRTNISQTPKPATESHRQTAKSQAKSKPKPKPSSIKNHSVQPHDNQSSPTSTPSSDNIKDKKKSLGTSNIQAKQHQNVSMYYT